MTLVNQLMFVTPSIESIYVYEALDRLKVNLDVDDPMALDHIFVLVKFSGLMNRVSAKKLIEQVHLNYKTIELTTNPRDNGFAHRRIYRARRALDQIIVDDCSKGIKLPIKNL